MSFRYHLVSIAAVLLALAVGVVLGAGPLSTKVNDALTKPTASAGSTPSAAGVAALRARVAYEEAFAAAAGKTLTSGRLKGRRVVLVVAPGTAPGLVKPVEQALVGAGATVSGEVDLTPAWADPARLAVLSGITDQLAPPDTKDSAGSPAQRSAAALAAGVLASSPKGVGRTSDPDTALLAGLTQGGFLTTKGSPDDNAGLAVLLVPAGARNVTALAPLAAALGAAGSGAVVAGPTGSARPGAPVAAVRTDPTADAAVSTVDTVDLGAGRVALVLALTQRAAGGRGDYGGGPGASSPLPVS